MISHVIDTKSNNVMCHLFPGILDLMVDVEWLTDDEQRIWRQWLVVVTGLPAALDRQLRQDSDLSLQDFEVLVALSDAEGRRLRMSPLAARLSRERTRLSHHVGRMEQRGLVCREACDSDRRCSELVLTDTGRDALEAAAPGHVRAVRDLVFDPLSAADTAALDQITDKLVVALNVSDH